MAKVVCLTAMLSATAGWRNPKTRIPIVPYSIPSHTHLPPRPPTFHTRRCRLISLKTHAASDKKQQQQQQQQIVEDEDEEEEMGWIQEKALDLVEFSGSVTQAIPGPRVAHTSLPWILAVPLAYLGLTFVLAFYKTLKKFSSPKAQRRRLVNKNVELIKSIDELFNSDREQLQHSVVQDLMNQTGFSAEDILRKYIRYALNEKPFNPDLVVDLIQLRKASMLSDTQVAETLNDISRRIVKDKGPVVMDASGYSEKGFKRKLAVQALFGKVLYLSELPEFCSRDNSLIVKEIFGVTDEDADKIRIQTLSDVEDMESLEKMVEGGSDSADNSES